MSSTDGAQRLGVCTNVDNCGKARAAETLEWYRGPGEYCPECGEALAPTDPSFRSDHIFRGDPAFPVARAAPTVVAGEPAPTIVPNSQQRPAEVVRAKAAGRHWLYSATSLRWAGILSGLFIAGAAALFFAARGSSEGNVVAVCSIPSAQQLASDLVRAYTTNSGTPASDFRLTNGNSCDVRFAAEAETPEAVIARDGIVAIVNPLNPISRLTDAQIRGIFSGSIRDWSQLGGAPGRIIPTLPDISSDEASVIATSVFFGTTLDGSIRRGGSSLAVVRAVIGADAAAQRTIGLAAFSQAIAAKVIPFANVPSPSVVSIESGRYPYTWTISVESGSTRSSRAAAGLIAYARSRAGAAIVERDGFVHVHFVTPKTLRQSATSSLDGGS